MAEGIMRATVVGFLVAAGFFTAWVAMDYGIARLVVGLVTWLMP
jgi:hypothetical protein